MGKGRGRVWGGTGVANDQETLPHPGWAPRVGREARAGQGSGNIRHGSGRRPEKYTRESKFWHKNRVVPQDEGSAEGKSDSEGACKIRRPGAFPLASINARSQPLVSTAIPWDNSVSVPKSPFSHALFGTARLLRQLPAPFTSARLFAPSTRRPCRVRASPPRRVVSRGPSRHGRSTTTIGRSSRRTRSGVPPRTVETSRTPGASR